MGREPTAGTDRWAEKPKFTLSAIQAKANVFERLKQRQKCSPDEFVAALDLRAKAYGQSSFTPQGSLDHIDSGVYYLESINDKYHRVYTRK